MNKYMVVINGSPRDVLAASPRVAVQAALKHVKWSTVKPGYEVTLRVTVTNLSKMIRLYQAYAVTFGFSNRLNVRTQYAPADAVPPGWYLTRDEALEAVTPD